MYVADDFPKFTRNISKNHIRFLVFETSDCDVETLGIHFSYFRGRESVQNQILCPSERYNPQTAISRRAVIACRDGDSGCDISRVDDVSLDTARKLPSTSVSKLRDRDLKRKDKKKEKNWKKGRNEACSNASVRFNSNFRSYYASQTCNNLLQTESNVFDFRCSLDIFKCIQVLCFRSSSISVVSHVISSFWNNNLSFVYFITTICNEITEILLNLWQKDVDIF